MKRTDLPVAHFPAWVIIAAFALSVSVQAATPVAEEIQPQEQEPGSVPPATVPPFIHTDREPATPLVELLDDARLRYLEGSAAEALALLDSADLARADTGERVAWLELYAFLLTATGAHQAAFDSLHMMHTIKTRVLQQQRAHLQEQFTDSLAAWTRQRSESLEAFRSREEDLASTNRTLLYALAGLIVVAGILLVILVFTRRKKEAVPPFVPATPAPAAVLNTPAKEPATVETTSVKTDGSDGGLLPHVERLSRLVSGGSTIEAAVYLDVLKRHMRMEEPLNEQPWLPLQQTVTLLRQQLKLAAMLLDVRPEHVVDVSGELRDAPVYAPARSLVDLLQKILPGHKGTTTPRVVVKFTRDSEHIRCTLRSNRGTMAGARSSGQENDDKGIRVKQVDMGSEGIGFDVEWPASMKFPAG